MYVPRGIRTTTSLDEVRATFAESRLRIRGWAIPYEVLALALELLLLGILLILGVSLDLPAFSQVAEGVVGLDALVGAAVLGLLLQAFLHHRFGQPALEISVNPHRLRILHPERRDILLDEIREVEVVQVQRGQWRVLAVTTGGRPVRIAAGLNSRQAAWLAEVLRRRLPQETAEATIPEALQALRKTVT